MANLDLSGYNLSELKGLQHNVEKAIKERQKDEIQKAREKILAIAKEAGVSIEDLVLPPAAKAKKPHDQKVMPRYQNPKNPTQTWTGRGRQPRWIAEGLAAGLKLDSFQIR